MLRIKFFAKIRESLSTEEISIAYSGQQNVVELIQTLVAKGEKWRVLVEDEVLVAVNHTLSDKHATIKDGDEIAFFPPVTGG